MKRKAPEIDTLLTVKEAASFLRVDRHVIEDMCKTGELPHIKLGPRQTRIPQGLLKEFVAARLRGAY